MSQLNGNLDIQTFKNYFLCSRHTTLPTTVYSLPHTKRAWVCVWHESLWSNLWLDVTTTRSVVQILVFSFSFMWSTPPSCFPNHILFRSWHINDENVLCMYFYNTKVSEFSIRQSVVNRVKLRSNTFGRQLNVLKQKQFAQKGNVEVD